MPGEPDSKSNNGMPVWAEQPPEFQKVQPPARLMVPLGSRSGAESKVKPAGAVVRKGEMLVEQAAESSHAPLAPADGTLGNVRPVTLTSGCPAAAVELIVDSADDCVDSANNSNGSPPRPDDPSSLVKWIERIRGAGVWADRHASPDLIGQLNQVVSRPVDTVVCTVLDSDASLRLHAAIGASFADEMAAGVAILAKMTEAPSAILAVEEYAGAGWMNPLREAAQKAKLEVVELANDYPQPNPTLMIYALRRRRLRPGNLPTSQGVLVVDAAAALAIGRAAGGAAMLRTPVAIHDHARRKSHYLDVAVGTPLEHLLEKLSIADDRITLRGGDLLRDVRLRAVAVIGGGELTIHVTGPEIEVIPEPCIRCAWCVEACPTLVNPASVLDAAQRHDPRMAERAGIGACIECGLCSHVCPSRLPLLEAIRMMTNGR